MPACRVGHVAETLKFERFQTELPPPYPNSYRFQFGIKVCVDGRKWGQSAYSRKPPGKKDWKLMEDDIRSHVAHCRANPII